MRFQTMLAGAIMSLRSERFHVLNSNGWET